MFTVAPATRIDARAARTPAQDQIAVALLGLGQVGSAVARLALESCPGMQLPVRITGALVRDLHRPRPTGNRVPLTAAGDELLDGAPDVVVEVLGGLEPARTLVLRALGRGIPVVTANKSLLAVHGDELFTAAAETRTPLRYEAAVLAGVPFLGTFTRRPLAASLASLCGVVNGTTNFILTEMSAGRAYPDALAEAQRRGFAEPDPSNDVLGVDAAQKLAVLLRHFAHCSVKPEQIETTGIGGLCARDLDQAAVLGGALKPIIAADWTGHDLSAFAGPAFVAASHSLARIDGVQNAIVLGGAPGGDLLFAGPGAGPVATAATILDDVVEATEQPKPQKTVEAHRTRGAVPAAPLTGWFIRLTGNTLPVAPDVADLLSARGVWLRRVSDDDGRDGRATRWLVAHPCDRGRIEAALAAVRTAAACDAHWIRALEERA
jgi:homoserine dehydrogenase